MIQNYIPVPYFAKCWQWLVVGNNFVILYSSLPVWISSYIILYNTTTQRSNATTFESYGEFHCLQILNFLFHSLTQLLFSFRFSSTSYLALCLVSLMSMIVQCITLFMILLCFQNTMIPSITLTAILKYLRVPCL